MSQTYEVVDYRWGDRYRPQEFIQKDSYEIERVASGFTATGDKLVEDIAGFIRDGFVYPLIAEQPSTDGQFLRFHQTLWKYYWKKCVFYMWSFPIETLTLFRAGVCIDTANLATTLFRAKGANAWTALGEVRKASTDELLGYHAWTIITYKGKPHLEETTIDQKGVNTLTPQKDTYNKNSEFAKKGDIYYIEHARYRENKYIGTTDLGTSGTIFMLMGRPLKYLKLYGLEQTLKIKPKKLYKQWKGEELNKQKEIFKAWF